MIYQEFLPSQNIKDFIRCYWSLNGDAGAGVEYTVIPDYCMDLIFCFNDDGVRGLIAGAGNQYYKLFYTNKVSIVGVRFFPGAFFKLFGIPASNFYNKIEYLDDVGLSIKTSDLFPDRYTDKSVIINILHKFFTTKLQTVSFDQISDELLHNAKLMDFNHSFLDYYSAKTFNRRLKELCGTSAQTFKNIVRFHKSISLMLADKYTYADIAYLSGYYDQPYFIKAFKDYSGSTPSGFIKDIKNNPVHFLQYPLGIF